MKTQLYTVNSGIQQQACVSISLETTDAITEGQECIYVYENTHIHISEQLVR